MRRKGKMERFRLNCDQSARWCGKMPCDVTVEKADYQPLYAEWIIPEGADVSKAMLYYRGEGFVMGSARSHRCLVANFVKMVGYKALLFNYLPAPEFSAPAAVNDSAAIYRWMLNQGYQPEDIIFAGDSAGGGIEIGTLLKLRDEGTPMPAACVAFSPNLDSCTPKDNLAGLPPIMIHVSSDEALRDSSTHFVETADSSGVDVRVKVWKGRLHCFPLCAPMFEEAAEAMRQVSSFIRHNMEKERDVASAFLYMMMLHCY